VAAAHIFAVITRSCTFLRIIVEMARVDKRKVHTLLDILKQYSSDFKHIEIEQDGLRVSASRAEPEPVSQVQQPAKRQDKPKSKPESAIASLSKMPPAFAWES